MGRYYYLLLLHYVLCREKIIDVYRVAYYCVFSDELSQLRLAGDIIYTKYLEKHEAKIFVYPTRGRSYEVTCEGSLGLVQIVSNLV